MFCWFRAMINDHKYADNSKRMIKHQMSQCSGMQGVASPEIPAWSQQEETVMLQSFLKWVLKLWELSLYPPPPTPTEFHEHRDESTRPERGDPQDAPLPQHRDREHQKASGNAGEPGSRLQGSAQLSTQASWRWESHVDGTVDAFFKTKKTCVVMLSKCLNSENCIDKINLLFFMSGCQDSSGLIQTWAAPLMLSRFSVTSRQEGRLVYIQRPLIR